MVVPTRQGMIAALLGRLRLRFPTLFGLLLAVTLFDLVVPDFLPFVDEIGLALLTMLLGLWRERRRPEPASPPTPPTLPPA